MLSVAPAQKHPWLLLLKSSSVEIAYICVCILSISKTESSTTTETQDSYGHQTSHRTNKVVRCRKMQTPRTLPLSSTSINPPFPTATT